MLSLSLTDSSKLNFNLQAKSINLTSFASLVDSAPPPNAPLAGADPGTPRDPHPPTLLRRTKQLF